MKAVVVVALLAMASCNDEPSKPKDLMGRLEAGNLSDEDLQRVTSTFPGMTKDCAEKVRVGGVNAMPRRAEDCFAMTEPTRWTGLWRNQFEGSQFCPSPARKCPEDASSDDIWLQFDERLPQSKMEPSGGLYAVDFIGRRTAQKGFFGHFGMSEHEMIVDRVISIREVEPPPPPPTKAETIEYWKRCEAAGNCIPNWERINNMEE